MWTLDACLQPLVPTVGAWNQVPLGPRKKIDDQSKQTGEHNEDHPEHRTVHTPGLGVSSDPNEQGNIERDNRDDCKYHQAHKTKTTAARGSTCGVIS